MVISCRHMCNVLGTLSTLIFHVRCHKLCHSHFNETNSVCPEIHNFLQEMVNKNRKSTGRIHAQDVLEISMQTINCGSAEMKEHNKIIMHCLVKMHHSKSAMFAEWKLPLKKILRLSLTLHKLNHSKLETKC